MAFLNRLPLPRRLSARLWLLSLPSALLSFERRQRLPKLPAGRWRFLGIPLVAAGLAIWLGSQGGSAPASLSGRALGRLKQRPGTAAGLMVLAGVALLLRSLLLALYSLGLALAAGSDVVTIEEPHPEILLRRSGRP